MMRRTFLTIVLLGAFLGLNAQSGDRWLHIFRQGGFEALKLEDIEQMRHRDTATESPMLDIVTSGGEISIPLQDIERFETGFNVPTIRINLTDHPEYTELLKKDTYLNATIEIDGNGIFDDLEPTEVTIKGRGNTTWAYAKKPYRLKFGSKTALLDFDKQKSYVLLANYLDNTLMRNAVAMEVAHLLDMPFTNHIRPVRLYFNGIYKGAYMLTEKVGISKTSVHIPEETGILFELDKNYDEAFRFRSPLYDLPVMVKDPDLTEIAATLETTPEVLFQAWKDDFTQFEQKVSEGTVTEDDLDLQSLVDYLIVFNICGNREPSWPKSVYMYKEAPGEPYHFGPVWDFDWAFTYNHATESAPPTTVLFSRWNQLLGEPFFRQLCASERFHELYAERWEMFVAEKLPLLYDYMDSYAAVVRPSALENGTVWPPNPPTTAGSVDFDNNVVRLKQWISERVEFISTHPKFGLF